VAQRLHNALGIKGRPTPIQKLAIPALLGEGEEAASGSLPDVAIQSPTGTGKSLAFLLPGVCGVDVRLARTQMMVVVPTRELAFQVHDLLRQIVPTKPNKKGNAFHLSRLTGVVRHRHLTDLRVFPPHVVVGTPQTLAHAIEEGAISKSHLRLIVFDEVDHLTSPFTASILPDLTSPGRVVYGEDRLRQGKSPRRAAPREGRGQRQGSTRETPRLVFVSATMPEGLLEGALPWQQEQGRKKPVHFHIPGGVPAGPRHEVLSLPTAEADARARAAQPWGGSGSGAALEAAAREAAGGAADGAADGEAGSEAGSEAGEVVRGKPDTRRGGRIMAASAKLAGRILQNAQRSSDERVFALVFADRASRFPKLQEIFEEMRMDVGVIHGDQDNPAKVRLRGKIWYSSPTPHTHTIRTLSLSLVCLVSLFSLLPSSRLFLQPTRTTYSHYPTNPQPLSRAPPRPTMTDSPPTSRLIAALRCRHNRRTPGTATAGERGKGKGGSSDPTCCWRRTC
jgi:hypothetical protein